MGRIGSIDELEEFDEFATAMAVLDQGVNLAGEQIDTGQQTDRAIALVLMIAREGRMFAGLRRQVRGGRSERLNARLLVIGDDRHRNRSPWQEDSHPLFLPFPCPYAHGELSTLPLSGFPWREDSQSFSIVAGQRQNWGSILGEFSRKPLNWDENRNIVLPLRPYLPLMLSV